MRLFAFINRIFNPRTENRFLEYTNKIFFILTLTLFLLSIYDIGFTVHKNGDFLIYNPYFLFLFPLTTVLYLLRAIIFTRHRANRNVFYANLLVGILLLVIFFEREKIRSGLLNEIVLFHFSIFHFFSFFLFVVELSRFKLDALVRWLNPAQLFIVSFAFIIFIGTLLLLLPQATTSPLSFTNAFFTSTSAVCVTGLTVVDTASRFTTFGKLIIMGLIQIGGIGVMTITSFFGVFFKETSSFREQMILRDYLSTDSFSGILKTLVKIILITFSIEIIGALIIYSTIQNNGFGSFGSNVRFSVFHSVSAFCNAGFSTLSQNLFDENIRSNYPFHYSIATLIILGGLGFPVFLNLYNYFKIQIVELYNHIIHRKPFIHRVGIITFNTKIVVVSTAVLLVFGTVIFFLLEHNATHQNLDFNGKLATSIFMSVTPRTAGFNTFSMDALAKPSIIILIFLMWVGASPASTGGGIKTSTFAVALLNIVRINRSKNHIETMRREIHEYSVNKAFAIITLSFLIIGAGTFAIFLIDGKLGLDRIVFECFSAFGTVGLSLNLTPLLSGGSKWILILLMFLGRMGIMTLLLSLAKRRTEGSALYRYPKENIVIT
ncbi:MAG TPA: potassium transporter TrkG [Draconibacterium sp.]|nr:potassium transporter TrkG [Draconibacterium sp.]